jgi:HD-GYP domain-containing protein (c-di-GMP phosphodiesterase class II)
LTDPSTISEQLGCRLIKAFYYIINAVRIHQDNNQLIKECATQLNAVAHELSCKGDIPILIWRGRFHVQGEKLLYRRENFHIINEMSEYFTQRKLGGVCLSAPFMDALPEDIVAFIRLLNESGSHDDPYNWLDQQREMNGFSWVEILRQPEEGQQNIDMQRREKAEHAYHQALTIVKEVAEKASKGIAGVRKARRLAQIMVDLVQEDNSLMLGLATIKDYDDYTYTHSVNVALLATCLGRQVGLSHVFLEHLTVCGLFHDLGKVGVSKEILLKPGELNADEWGKMQRHPIIGVRKILRLQAPNSLKSRIILGPFEHHLNPDLSGYPKTHFMKKVSLIGRILRIVDVYEALTSERSYRPRAFSPDEALRRMWCEKGKNFDPLLLKCFINMMGIYPIGTIVELDSGETGLVMGYPDEAEKALPLVMLLVDDGKGNLTQGERVNLAEQGINEGLPRRNIVKGIPLSRIGIQPSHYFLQGGEEYEGSSPQESV